MPIPTIPWNTAPGGLTNALPQPLTSRSPDRLLEVAVRDCKGEDKCHED